MCSYMAQLAAMAPRQSSVSLGVRYAPTRSTVQLFPQATSFTTRRVAVMARFRRGKCSLRGSPWPSCPRALLIVRDEGEKTRRVERRGDEVVLSQRQKTDQPRISVEWGTRGVRYGGWGLWETDAPGPEGVDVVALEERRRVLPAAGELRHALARLQPCGVTSGFV